MYNARAGWKTGAREVMRGLLVRTGARVVANRREMDSWDKLRLDVRAHPEAPVRWQADVYSQNGKSSTVLSPDGLTKIANRDSKAPPRGRESDTELFNVKTRATAIDRRKKRTPTFPKGHDARARLLAAATESFSRHGFESSSLRTIADQAGVAFQLIPYYFGSKEELWSAVVEALFDDLVTMGSGLSFDQTGDVQAQFHTHLVAILSYWRHKPELKMIMTQEALSRSDRHHQFGTPLKLWQRVTAEYFSRVVEVGAVTRFSGDEAYSILRAYVASILFTPYEYEAAVPGVSPDDPECVEKQATFLFNLLVHGKGVSKT